MKAIIISILIVLLAFAIWYWFELEEWTAPRDNVGFFATYTSNDPRAF